MSDLLEYSIVNIVNTECSKKYKRKERPKTKFCRRSNHKETKPLGAAQEHTRTKTLLLGKTRTSPVKRFDLTLQAYSYTRKKVQKQVITAMHIIGHFGMTETSHILRAKHWFPSLKCNILVEDEITRCSQCQISTTDNKQEPVKLSKIVETAWQMLSVDFGRQYPIGHYNLNPIMVDNYAAFFNCTPVGRASDSLMAPT